jgi:hypothetical protein
LIRAMIALACSYFSLDGNVRTRVFFISQRLPL